MRPSLPPDQQDSQKGLGALGGSRRDRRSTRDLHKRPETTSDLQFGLITGSRRFALFRDVSRPARGLRKSGCVTPVTAYLKVTPAATGLKPFGQSVL